MEKISRGFTTFMLSVLKVLITIVIIVSLGTSFMLLKGVNTSVVTVSLVLGIVLFSGYRIIKSSIDQNKKIGCILILAFILRMLWLLNVNSMPNSDFRTIYNCAGDLLNGDTSMFYGTSYIARFPHLTIMVLYMAAMRWLFPINNIVVMKGANLILGVVTVYLIYLIIKELFNNEKYSLYGALGATIFPPLVTYTAVFCTENIAIPFYLSSIYVFLLALKKKRNTPLLIMCGILLSLGNLFRMVAVIVLIAYSLYLTLYSNYEVKKKISNIVLIVLPYFIVLWLVSGILNATKITEFPLWKGSEPGITNVLKGTHYESGGRWNPEDAALPAKYNYDYKKVEEESKKIIIERLTTTPPLKLAGFYIKKFAMQWSEGDLSGVFWSYLDSKENSIKINLSGYGMGLLQIVYSAILILCLIGMFNKKAYTSNKTINLFYLILCGYGASYLITESQGRYSYIACWVFIILALAGIDFLKTKYMKYKG